MVERVTSPWALAEQDGVPPTQPSQSQASQPPPSGGRPSIGGQSLPRSGGRRSLLGVSNVRRASGGSAGTGATPASAVRPEPNAGGAEGKLPTPWSTLRPWDGKAAAAAADAPTQDENKAGPPQQQPQPEAQDHAEQPGGGDAGASGDAGGPRRATRHAAEPAAACDAGGSVSGPSHGCIALTSVDGAVVDLARSATRRLRGLRICPEGKEDGQVCVCAD